MIWLISILLPISMYVIFNLFRKNEKLDEANSEANAWLEAYYTSLSLILLKIRELDSKNMFETDDEVGSVYVMISDEIKKLENLIGK